MCCGLFTQRKGIKHVFFFQAEDGIRDVAVTGVQTCALPISLVHVNGTFGRGTVGVDLNAIPAAAIERIEVLRDGAAAQYGSDAIAGVINIVLTDRASGMQASSVAGVTGEGDGQEVKADINAGFGIGERGFFNVTAEYLDRQATDRAGPYSGPIFVRPVPGTYTDSLRQIDQDSLTAYGLTRGDFSMRIGQAAP